MLYLFLKKLLVGAAPWPLAVGGGPSYLTLEIVL
jgi:hypothetical protein